MKKLIMLVIFLALLKAGYDHFLDPNAPRNVDKKMQRIVEEMNGKLPQTMGNTQIDSVEYADRVMRFNGTISSASAAVTEQEKSATRSAIKKSYCAGPLRKAEVSVVYQYRQLAARSISDRIHTEQFQISINPSDC